MLKRRLQGVLRQYGPIVAFVTTGVLLGNRDAHPYLRGPTPKTMPPVVHDITLLAFLRHWLGRSGTVRRFMATGSEASVGELFGDVYRVNIDRAPPEIVHREEARLRARLAVVFERFLERGDWPEWQSVVLISSPELRRIFVDDVWPTGVRNADYYRSSIRDVVVPWVASIVNRYVKYGVPIVTSNDIEYLARNIFDITDWANATHPNLMRMSVQAAVDGARDWHEELKRTATAEAVGMGEVVHRFPDGWTFQKLATRKLLLGEGQAQGICVGQEGYVRAVERGEMVIYSLRDAKNVPHVTVEAQVKWQRTVGAGEPIVQLAQVKGRGNALIKSPALCRRLDEVFEILGIRTGYAGTQRGATTDWRECYLQLQTGLVLGGGEEGAERAANPVRSSWDDAVHARLGNPRAKRGRPAPRMPEGATTYMVPVRKGLLPARLYHVTLSQHVPAIMRQGLVPMKTSNWRKGGAGGARYGEGEVFAFEDKYDALHWAAKWDLNHHKMLGSGKVSIVELDNAFDDWEIDVADPLAQMQAAGRWLKRRSAIGPQHIVRADVFTPADAQHWLAEQRRRLYGGG